MEGNISVANLIDAGLQCAARDYLLLSKKEENFDVKPKEDQIKCALYKAFYDAGYLVHVEASYTRNGARCDLLATNAVNAVAIEIKTAWAGDGWVNKPTEQYASWIGDIEKIRGLIQSGRAIVGYFVLCFAYQKGARSEAVLREKIKSHFGMSSFSPVEISGWNGLTEFQFWVAEVMPA